MEKFSVRHSTPGTQRLLLLPVSLGASSVSLLHVLTEHLESQKRRIGRTGYDLHVVFVDGSAAENIPQNSKQKLELTETRNPAWEYSTIDLSEVGNLPDFETLYQETNSELPPDGNKLEQLLASLPSASSRLDIVSVLRTRLLIHFAKQRGCECILWGDSTTRLAERTLSETAKGRGFALPWAVSDGPTAHGINYHFPMRDLLRKEIVTFTELFEPSLMPLIEQAREEVVATAKNTSIDQLMAQYFQSVEENYPSIVANVVRTTSRLNKPPHADGQKCDLCQTPMDAENIGGAVWGGYQEDRAELGSNGVGRCNNLCYGCARTIPPGGRLST